MSQTTVVLIANDPRLELQTALRALQLQPIHLFDIGLAQSSLNRSTIGLLLLYHPQAEMIPVLRDWQAAGLMAPIVVLSPSGHRLNGYSGLLRLHWLAAGDDALLLRRITQLVRPTVTGLIPLERGSLNLEQRSLLIDGESLSLTPREAGLLAFLVARAGELVSEDLLLREVWGNAPGVVSRAVHHTLHRLRAKLERDPAHPFHLRTETGQGFRFIALPTAEVSPTDPAPLVNVLPAERDSFVGRQSTLHDLHQRLIQGARLVSVVGIGGTGKTRLVVHYAWSQHVQWPGGIWFCDLSEARNIEDIVSVIAQTFNLCLGKEDPILQLGHVIAGRGKCLIILDNFEQISRYAYDILNPWLDRAPEAQWIVTTREVLGISGEYALALAPLPLTDGIDLFRQRALRIQHDFQPTQAETLEALVHLLDGLPLAIELAAARIRLMSPEQLLARMGQRFELLRGSGSRQDRQATLRATLDWSWELLNPDEQSGLAQLSCFEGGFDLEAAEAILEIPKGWPTDVLQGLVDKSLLRRNQTDRFELLVSVQVYAAERLSQMGQEKQCYLRHGNYYAHYGSDAALDALESHGGSAQRQRLTPEISNMMMACRRACHHQQGTLASQLLRALWGIIAIRGPFMMLLRLSQQVLALPEACFNNYVQAQGHILHVIAEVQTAMGKGQVANYLNALEACEKAHDTRSTSILLNGLAWLHQQQGRPNEAEQGYTRALAYHRHHHFLRDEGVALGHLGLLYMQLGQILQSHQCYQEALQIHQRTGNRRSEGIVLSNLGMLTEQQGHLDEAARHYEAARQIHAEVGNHRSEGIIYSHLASLEEQQGRPDAALHNYQLALKIHRDVGNRRSEGIVLCNIGLLYYNSGQYLESRQCYDTALAIAREVGNRRSEGILLHNIGCLYHHDNNLEEARNHYEAARIIHSEVGNKSFYGLSTATLGGIFKEKGQLQEAKVTIMNALLIFESIQYQAFEGEFWGELAHVEMLSGQWEAAHEALAKAEALLRKANNTLKLAHLLCYRGQYECHFGNKSAASATLTEAKGHYQAFQKGTNSYSLNELALLERMIAAIPT